MLRLLLHQTILLFITIFKVTKSAYLYQRFNIRYAEVTQFDYWSVYVYVYAYIILQFIYLIFIILQALGIVVGLIATEMVTQSNIMLTLGSLMPVEIDNLYIAWYINMGNG